MPPGNKETSIDTLPENNLEPSPITSKDKILLPRWVVYFQASLLGISAVTFFIFGMLVGSLNSNSQSPEANLELTISGTVLFGGNSQSSPDAGAVVLLLPTLPENVTRHSPDNIQPDNFEPLENPVIHFVRSQGGSIVRTNSDGKFELYARAGRYCLIVVSKNRSMKSDQKLSRQQVASLSQYFLPVENLIQTRAYYWEDIDLEKDISRDDILFE